MRVLFAQLTLVVGDGIGSVWVEAHLSVRAERPAAEGQLLGAVSAGTVVIRAWNSRDQPPGTSFAAEGRRGQLSSTWTAIDVSRCSSCLGPRVSPRSPSTPTYSTSDDPLGYSLEAFVVTGDFDRRTVLDALVRAREHFLRVGQDPKTSTQRILLRPTSVSRALSPIRANLSRAWKPMLLAGRDGGTDGRNTSARAP